ncbi:MAG: phosphoribosylanthranilate isomerase, partial [Bacilli bacterium]
MSKIKICGITSLEEITFINKYLPDYIGFVFASSKRQVSFEQAKLLSQHTAPT